MSTGTYGLGSGGRRRDRVSYSTHVTSAAYDARHRFNTSSAYAAKYGLPGETSAAASILRPASDRSAPSPSRAATLPARSPATSRRPVFSPPLGVQPRSGTRSTLGSSWTAVTGPLFDGAASGSPSMGMTGGSDVGGYGDPQAGTSMASNGGTPLVTSASGQYTLQVARKAGVTVREDGMYCGLALGTRGLVELAEELRRGGATEHLRVLDVSSNGFWDPAVPNLAAALYTCPQLTVLDMCTF